MLVNITGWIISKRPYRETGSVLRALTDSRLVPVIAFNRKQVPVVFPYSVLDITGYVRTAGEDSPLYIRDYEVVWSNNIQDVQIFQEFRLLARILIAGIQHTALPENWIKLKLPQHLRFISENSGMSCNVHLFYVIWLLQRAGYLPLSSLQEIFPLRTARFIEQVVPIIRDVEALENICLSNEISACWDLNEVLNDLLLFAVHHCGWSFTAL